MPVQYPCQKVHKVTRSEIMSLGCLQDSVPTRKLQDLESIKSTKEQHACSGGRTG